MEAIQSNPYLFFKGQCREAMHFYHDIFGGTLTFQTYADANMVSKDTPEDFIMHASLTGGSTILFASDTPQASTESAKIAISLSGPNETELRKIFEGLSADVTVQYPLEKAPWGDTFGSLRDKYGVEWMVNISAV
jgi:PhnB protein